MTSANTNSSFVESTNEKLYQKHNDHGIYALNKVCIYVLCFSYLIPTQIPTLPILCHQTHDISLNIVFSLNSSCASICTHWLWLGLTRKLVRGKWNHRTTMYCFDYRHGAKGKNQLKILNWFDRRYARPLRARVCVCVFVMSTNRTNRTISMWFNDSINQCDDNEYKTVNDELRWTFPMCMHCLLASRQWWT